MSELSQDDIRALQATAKRERAVQILQNFWFELDDLEAQFANQTPPPNIIQMQAKFVELLTQYVVPGIVLEITGYPVLQGINNVAYGLALSLTTGILGEQHISSYPVYRSEGNLLALYYNDLSFIAKTANGQPANGSITFGRKGVWFNRKLKITKIVVVLRSAAPYSAPFDPWREIGFPTPPHN